MEPFDIRKSFEIIEKIKNGELHPDRIRQQFESVRAQIQMHSLNAQRQESIKTQTVQKDARKPRAYWIAVLLEHYPAMERKFGMAPDPREAIRYLKGLGDARIPNEGPPDILCWKTAQGDKKQVGTRRVSNCMSQEVRPYLRSHSLI